jgi:hypothetical protein
MKNLKILTEKEQELLLKYPVYIVLLALNKDARIDDEEKSVASKFLHIKTYSGNPLLKDFYDKADESFERDLTELDKTLPKDKVARETTIRNRLAEIENILQKLDPEYASLLHASMQSFKEHVSKAHFNVLEYFIFPLPIKGITE